MLQIGHKNVRLKPCHIDIGIAKNHSVEPLNRVSIATCRDTAIDESLMIHILV